MKDYQKRVIEEKEELDKKITSLTNFLFSNLSINLTNKERNLMQEQLNIMIQYTIVLEHRISLFM